MERPLIFEPISLSLKDRVESVRREFGNTLYVYTFASLYAWQEDEQYEICFCKDAFLVKNGAEGENAFLFPCGSESGKKELLDALLQYKTLDFYCLTDEDKAFLEKEYPDRFEFTESRNEFIYLFDRDAQLALEGKEYKKQRHQINIGKASAKEWKTERLTEANVERAIKINQAWAERSTFLGGVSTSSVSASARFFCLSNTSAFSKARCALESNCDISGYASLLGFRSA